MPLTEVVFYGRGGQGAVTAANLLASAALKSGNEGVQAFPLFGAERRGAPVKAFARISDTKIYLRSQIYFPDIVVILDTGIMDTVNVTSGLKEEGTVLMNTPRSPEEIDMPFRVATVDATGIAIENKILVGGIPVVNTPIIGALPKLMDNLTIGAVREAIIERWGKNAGEKNADAAEKAYEGVRIK
ncbi:MAG: pyruvate ferredoxin oxidoreductase [Thermoplasmata archaeon]|jgi:pyruvate ferredoxin oxidoreductase gamma subunit/2-oxoisovalerate ferredoxin oxidoreductase gamma subunit|nr:MAG: pyruvate ferredoxin oxidoreductase [Thermoplasmata archaeon]RLF62989.1 MAG: pyruvate ferredoxin oxidoreductase [Thermoplasmata archaeon]